jgi:hypothetical protein
MVTRGVCLRYCIDRVDATACRSPAISFMGPVRFLLAWSRQSLDPFVQRNLWSERRQRLRLCARLIQVAAPGKKCGEGKVAHRGVGHQVDGLRQPALCFGVIAEFDVDPSEILTPEPEIVVLWAQSNGIFYILDRFR